MEIVKLLNEVFHSIKHKHTVKTPPRGRKEFILTVIQKSKPWKSKNPKIKCCNCAFDKTCRELCTYFSIKKFKDMRQHERVRKSHGLRPRPFEKQ